MLSVFIIWLYYQIYSLHLNTSQKQLFQRVSCCYHIINYFTITTKDALAMLNVSIRLSYNFFLAMLAPIKESIHTLGHGILSNAIETMMKPLLRMTPIGPWVM